MISENTTDNAASTGGDAEALHAGHTPGTAAARLVKEAYVRGSTDNLSALVADLSGLPKFLAQNKS